MQSLLKGYEMKHIKGVLTAMALTGMLGAATPALAVNDALYGSEQWSREYMASVRPLVAKLAMADKKKVMDMEMAIMRMESDHAMTMMKMDTDHKMAIAKMRRELEEFIYGKGAF